MKHPTTMGLFQYWNDVRGARIAPRRYEIEPSKISPFLAETVILERPEDDGCRIRIAGSQVCDWLGDDLNGHLFYELWDEKDKLVLQDNVQAVVDHGGVGLFDIAAPLNGDDQPAEFEMLLLPLMHMGHRVERILGCISALSAPNWLTSARPHHLYLTANKVLWPDGRPRYSPENKTEPSAPVPSLRHDQDVRHVRLVQHNRRRFIVYEGGRSDKI